MTALTRLPNRAVIEITGEDRVTFLQGLVSNDVALAATGRCVWAALLTPQGKWLADFFIFAEPDRLLLDCEVAQVAMLMQRLARFRLRSRAMIAARDDLCVYAAWDGPPDGSIVAPDPRLLEAGYRILDMGGLTETAGFDDWDRHRISLGLPDGSRDLESEKTVLLESGFDELNGVSWSKGCYMGQELTARTKYRGLVKRRLVPVTIEGVAPERGTPILRDGGEVGSMRSSCGNLGLALLRLDAFASPLACGDARLARRVPGWMRLPEPAA